MKMFRRILASFVALLTLALCLSFSEVKLASAEIQQMHDYHLLGQLEMAIPKAYTVRTTIRTFQSPTNAVFKEPGEMVIDKNDNIYVADTGNHRIVKTDNWGQFLMEITAVYCNECDPATINAETGVYESCTHLGKTASSKFNKPQGVCVTAQYIYVADTGNQRIILLDLEGNFVKCIEKPTDPALNTITNFEVKKLAVNNKGVMYVLLTTDFQGLMMIDENGEYMGNTGMTRTTINFVDYLWSKLSSSDSELVQRTSLVAPPYSNFMIDDSGWIYATVATVEEKQITKLNTAGANVFGSADEVTGSITGKFGRDFETITDTETYSAMRYVSNFVDLTVDPDGIVYALDDTLGNIFLYDQECNNLAFFGELGTSRGKFTKPIAIDIMSDGALAVLDTGSGYITVFDSTQFCELMKEGTSLYRNAEYDKARGVWEELLKLDANYIYAHRAIAKAYYKEDNYVKAMEEYKLAKDMEGYSMAFEDNKKELSRKYFFLIVLVVIALVVGVVIGFKKLNKYVTKLHLKITTWGGDEE